MPIDPTTAARIAKAAGLTLTDARALAAMADTNEDAQRLASIFDGHPGDGEESTERAFLRQIMPTRTPPED